MLVRSLPTKTIPSFIHSLNDHSARMRKRKIMHLVFCFCFSLSRSMNIRFFLLHIFFGMARTNFGLIRDLGFLSLAFLGFFVGGLSVSLPSFSIKLILRLEMTCLGFCLSLSIRLIWQQHGLKRKPNPL